MSQFQRRSVPIAAIAACAVSMVVAVAPAGAKTTTTLHFFAKQVSFSLVGPNGKPLPPTSTPVPGDRINSINDYYVGNHKHHATRATVSNHVECTFIDSMGDAMCSAQIAIGGSMLLATDVTLSLGQGAPPKVPINGGTGKYLHAHGVLMNKRVGKGKHDVTLKFTT
jgi:hypothetical protein